MGWNLEMTSDWSSMGMDGWQGGGGVAGVAEVAGGGAIGMGVAAREGTTEMGAGVGDKDGLKEGSRVR